MIKNCIVRSFVFAAVFAVVLVVSGICQETKTATQEFSPEFRRKLENLEILYKKALLRETYGASENSIYAYDAILSAADSLINSSSLDINMIEAVAPYYIGSAYRKGILTHKFVQGSVIKLHRQLKLYEDADKWIDQVLTSLSNFYVENKATIFPTQFGMLYYSKAYNRAGWAFAMLNGSSWKRYLIYPPSDTMVMIDKCALDLLKMLSSYGFPYERGRFHDYRKGIDSYVDLLPQESSEYKTLTLCYGYRDKKSVKKLLLKQIEVNIDKTLNVYNSGQMQDAIAKGKTVYAFEEFIKPESKEFIIVISKFLAQMESQ